jgi:hypothetical protein
MTKTTVLEPKLIGDIEGTFIVPDYQRGYRWEKEHIVMLLDDIYDNGELNYCLQPIVVKELEDSSYELIDGQQRLTTIFLILKYVKQLLPSIEQKFSLGYVTRPRSAEFLNNLDQNLSEENIDFFHIYNAYKTIDDWFTDSKTDKTLKAINLYKYFCENVKVIWYQVNNEDEPAEIFTRLNIGKIPLTNAELVKALFLSRDSKDITQEKQLEIATSWDTIEQELHNDAFWAFITNEHPENYATRIELIFDMMANKRRGEKGDLTTFFYFLDRMKKEAKLAIWDTIREYFLVLKEWFEKRNIYHKVGYLVATGEKLDTLISGSFGLTKSEFEEYLIGKIIERLDLTRDQVIELNYTYNKEKIEDLLLLFNVESIDNLKDSFEKYSFRNHKKRHWSLEHIHAQNSEGLNHLVDQRKWLDMHRQSLEVLLQNSDNPDKILNVIKDINDNYDNLKKEKFDLIFGAVISLLSEDEDRSYLDSISNMALLTIEDNAALNNSAFDVKRNKILEMDKNGEYIPICTRRVFLKYYTESEYSQLQFWGDKDRIAYLNAMIGENGLLVKYLKPSSKVE